MYAALFYQTAPDYLVRRQAWREQHLALLGEWHAQGKLVLAGAVKPAGGDPDSALLVFRCDSLEEPAAFAALDPYVRHGVVTGWMVKEWVVVVGHA